MSRLVGLSFQKGNNMVGYSSERLSFVSFFLFIAYLAAMTDLWTRSTPIYYCTVYFGLT